MGRRYIVRRNPGTGRWIVYRRTGVRLSWNIRTWARTSQTVPVYEIAGAYTDWADTLARVTDRFW